MFPYMEIEVGIEIGMNLKCVWKFEMGMISEMEIEIGLKRIVNNENRNWNRNNSWSKMIYRTL